MQATQDMWSKTLNLPVKSCQKPCNSFAWCSLSTPKDGKVLLTESSLNAYYR